MIRLDELNALAPPDFVAQLAGIFEHSPWVAAGALAARPFNSRLQLLDAMRRTVQTADESAQLALIRAHPQLGARAANAPALTAASTREQRRAGLDACSGEQRQLLALLNAQYLARFGFPFILAVRGHDPASIIACCKQRLTQTGASEQRMALTQIGQIAAYRLADLVVTAPEAEILAMRERLALAQQRSPLLREWMLAAGLEIWLDEAGALLGCRRGAMALSRRLLLGVELLGVEVDPRRLSLHCTGSLAVLTAIAVAQQLRQRALVLPFDVLLLSWPEDARAGDLARLAEPGPRSGMALSELTAAPGTMDAAHASDLEMTRSALHAAGVETGAWVPLRSEAAIGYGRDVRLDEGLAGQAARALEDFLMGDHAWLKDSQTSS